MPVDADLRSLFGIIAGALAIVLVIQLAIGRANFGWRALAGFPIVTRATEPRPYWGAVGMNAIFVLTFGFQALFYVPRYGYLVFLGLLSGYIFEMLVSGRVASGFGPRFVSRAERPGTYWGWVIFHAVFSALVLALLFWTLARPVGT